MADDVTLLPCKVCNSKRAVPVRYESRSYGPYWRVSCANCEYDGPARKTKEAAIAAWNACVPNPRIAALEAATRELSHQYEEADAERMHLRATAEGLALTLREREAELAAIKARRCETCKHWSRVADNDFGVCGFWTDDRSTWHAYDDERCRNWQGEEAADA